MRFGRYRYEWISCDHSEPVPPDNPFTITVGPDLQYVGWHNQPADAGVDLPRNKTYYRLGLRNKVAAIREGRFWMVWFWKNYKKAHKECRGKSFKIPHDLTWVDATQERITLGSRSGVQVSMSSNFGSKPFERTSRRTGKTVPC